MKKKIVLIVCLMILVGFVGALTQSTTSDPVETVLQKQYLDAEYELAQNPKLYFIFNMIDGLVQVKAGGVVLREWRIATHQFWGDPIPRLGIPLLKKSTLFPPKRENIKPGQAAQSKDFKLDTLEVADMPSSYTLILDEGIKVYITSKPEGFFRFFTRIGQWLRWHTASPFYTLWNAAKKKKYTALTIEFASPQDAQSLYWVFAESTPAIFILPKEISTPNPR